MSDFLASNPNFDVILLLAIVVYLTRIGGYLIIVQFGHINPRVEAALNAVPAAVIATLVFPAALTSGMLEFVTMIFVALACLRLSTVWALALGLIVIAFGRNYFGL